MTLHTAELISTSNFKNIPHSHNGEAPGKQTPLSEPPGGFA